MLLSTAQDSAPSLLLLEGGLTLIAIAGAFCLPHLGSSTFRRMERAFGRLARKQGLAVAVVGLSTLLAAARHSSLLSHSSALCS
jgi:hypothetical protein